MVSTNNAPPAIGPYSQAVWAGSFLFLSGQLPLDPKSGIMVGDGIETQTKQAISNIKSILSATGLSLANIVKTTVFLKNIQHFPQMNNTYKEYFYEDAPARSYFEVSNLPMNALIEIESVTITE
ncbi:Rid family detoxifying hydrolase [Chloroflexota bacterium]